MVFLGSIFVIWALAVVSPGPNLFLVLRYSLSGERRSGLAAVGGIACGTFLWGLAGLLGLTSLFQTAPTLFLVMKLCGASYLAYCGVKMLKAAIANRYEETITVGTSQRSVATAFRSGLVTNLSNPKSAIFVTALFAAAMPHPLPLAYGLCGVLLMMSISIIWYGLVALLFSSRRASAMAKTIRRTIDAVAGAAFLIFAGKLMLSQK